MIKIILCFSYVNATAVRNFDDSMYASHNATVEVQAEQVASNPYAALVALVPFGLLFIIGVCVFLCVKDDACIPKAWVK